jgi:NADH-quinone oxidoreductase subunit L
VLGFVMLLSGVRTRRGAANLTILSALVSLASIGLVTWAQYAKSSPLSPSFQFVNISAAFTGPLAFQTFEINVTLKLDHFTLAALAVLNALLIAVVVWHRRGIGRREPGPVRFHALLLLFTIGAAGVLVSTDLSALAGFWGIAGVATYLLLTQRWGQEGPTRAARAALALPAIADLALLCGLAILYSRYGSLDPAKLFGVLHVTSGWGYKSLTVAALLIFAAAAGRSALFPFHGWQSTTLEAPPGGVALIQAVWPLLGASLLLRMLPVLLAANVYGMRTIAYACAVGALAGPLLAVAGNDIRRSLTLAGTGVSAVGLLAVIQPKAGLIALTAMVAAAPLRAALVLAAANVVFAMKSLNLADMGGIFSRMRATALTLLLAGAGLAAAFSPAWTVAARSRAVAAMGAAIFLVAFVYLWIYFCSAHGPLRRRRAFEPERVRDAPGAPLVAAGFLTVVGVGGVVLAYSPWWFRYLDFMKHAWPQPRPVLIWLAVPAAGIVLALLSFLAGKDSAVRLTGWAGGLLATGLATAAVGFERYVSRPGLSIIYAIEGWGISGGEGVLGSALYTTGRLAGIAVPAVLVLAALVALLAVLTGLLSPQVYR